MIYCERRDRDKFKGQYLYYTSCYVKRRNREIKGRPQIRSHQMKYERMIKYLSSKRTRERGKRSKSANGWSSFNCRESLMNNSRLEDHLFGETVDGCFGAEVPWISIILDLRRFPSDELFIDMPLKILNNRADVAFSKTPMYNVDHTLQCYKQHNFWIQKCARLVPGVSKLTGNKTTKSKTPFGRNGKILKEHSNSQTCPSCWFG